MLHLALFLLGPPRVERDGSGIPIPRHKSMALLAYLALTRRRHRRDALATLLWPEHDQATSRAYLRRALTALRNALGEDWLDADRETVGLDPDAGLWLDVDAFHGQLSACRTHGHPPGETCPDCLPLLEQAAALYHDDLLAGFTLRDSPAYDDWQFFQTQALRDELAGVLQRLAEGYAAQGAFDQAIPHARRWLALDPLHEPAHRALMRLYAWAGQRAAALYQYAECQRVLQEELGASPEEETVQLYETIQAHRELPPPTGQSPQTPSPAAARQHNLPAQLTPFVGREALLGEIGAHLDHPDCRLLTLVGPGGSGKTRLVLETASRQLDAYPDGVWFVPLAPVESVEGIVPAVAEAMDFAFHGEGAPREQLLAYLRQRKTLLVLDNFEHLLPGAGLAVDILTEAADVKILVTSRARLNLQSEHLHPIEGMEYPKAGVREDAGRFSALKLFVSAARRAEPGFALSEQNRDDVIRICQLVEGMPLGILLSAAWVGALSPAEIAGEIARSLDFLETDWRDFPARHTSVRAVFDHSWALLDERGREILSEVSVFRGGFTRGAAERVVDASLRELMALVHRSLLHRTATGRYEMHELLRQYAAEKLAAEPNVERETRDRHCAYYAAALERWDADLKGPRQLTALAEVEADIGNARAAWEWAVEQRDVTRLDQAIDGLCRFYEWRGHYEEGEAACRAAIAALGRPEGGPAPPVPSDHLRVRARATAWRGVFCQGARRLEQARHLLEESLADLETLATAGQDARREKAFALYQLGYTAFQLSDWEDARRRYEDSLALHQALGQRWERAVVLYHVGDLLMCTEIFDEAEMVLRESLAIHRDLGDRRQMGGSLRVLGLVALFTGRLEESESLARESVAAFQATGDRAHAAEALINLGNVLDVLGKLAEARIEIEESVAIYEDLGFSGSSSLGALRALGWADLLLGRYETARSWAQKSLALARKRGQPHEIRRALDVLCMAAIAEGEYAQAQQLWQQAHRDPSGGPSVWEVAGWTHVTYELGQTAQARRRLYQALWRGRERGYTILLANSLAAIALLLADRGEAERAVELYALAASRYPYIANAPFYEDIAGKHIAAAARTLPPDVVAAAQERGRARNLKATVQELLEELGEESGEE